MRKNKTLLFMTTHLLVEAVILEYKKLSKTGGFDCILVVDNTNLHYDVPKKSPICKLKLFGVNVKCFFFDKKINDDLKLPVLSAHLDEPDFTNVMWANADYRFYYVRKFLPEYDYYWQFDYDVFCNGKTYKSFLNKYNNLKDDLLIPYFHKVDRNSGWCWVNGTDWIYGGKPLYSSFFPVCRLSKNAVDFLYEKRVKYGTVYNENNSKDKKWPFSELFVPTELMCNGFSCSSITESTIRLTKYNLNEHRFFENPDGKLYHPVKCSANPIPIREIDEISFPC